MIESDCTVRSEDRGLQGVFRWALWARRRPYWPRVLRSALLAGYFYKGNVKWPPCTPWKRVRGAKVELHLFLTLAPDGGEWRTVRALILGTEGNTMRTAACKGELWKQMKQFELLMCKEVLHKQQYKGKCNVHMCTHCCDCNWIKYCVHN